MTDINRARLTLLNRLADAEQRLEDSTNKSEYMYAKNSIDTLNDLIDTLSS